VQLRHSSRNHLKGACVSISSIIPLVKLIKAEPDRKFRILSSFGRRARTRGYFTKAEFLEVCRWKSRRRIGLCESNSEADIQFNTATAFSAPDEHSRMEALLTIRGVAVPTASALLAASDPSNYGVIDIRAWQLLHQSGLVRTNKKGRNLSINNWKDYLGVLRKIAHKAKSTPRLVEIALYWAHKNRQIGPLYPGKAHSSSSNRLRCWRQLTPWKRTTS
jgi:hypothetical protein